MPYQKMIGIVLKNRIALVKNVGPAIDARLVIPQAGVAGLDLFLSAARCPCCTGLVVRGPPGTLPLARGFTRRGLRALCFAVLVLAPRLPWLVPPDEVSVSAIFDRSNGSRGRFGYGSRCGLRPQATGS